MSISCSEMDFLYQQVNKCAHRSFFCPMDTSTEQNTLNIRQEEKADGAIGQKKGRGAHQQNRTR